MIPWIYLKGVSAGNYAEALQSLLGTDAKGLSPNFIVRLKEKWGQEYEEWSRRDLSGEEFGYVWAALREVYPTTKEQRCWVHKTANVLNKMPKALQAKAKSDLHQIWLAETRGAATKAFDHFLKNTVPSTRRRAAASRRIATSSWPSTTSRRSTGVTCGRPNQSRAPSRRSACGIAERRAAARGRPASP